MSDQDKVEKSNEVEVPQVNLAHCVGAFVLSDKVLIEAPVLVQKLMEGMVVTLCQYDANRRIYFYQAMSPYFNEVRQSFKMPEYKVVLNTDSDNVQSLAFELIQ